MGIDEMEAKLEKKYFTETYSVETELHYREIDNLKDWDSIKFIDADEFVIGKDKIKPNSQYEIRIRSRFLDKEDNKPVTEWGPWSRSLFLGTSSTKT